jgi:phospholipase/carboxylesterase
MTAITPPIPCVEALTGEAPVMSIVWLHGLGADGHDFGPIVPELGLKFAARFVFPHAPFRPITINGGMQMRAWFNILGIERSAAEDEPGIRSSAALVERLIDREVARGIPSHRIVLAGFSQGGAMALHAGLRHRDTLAGVLALSAFLPLARTLADEGSAANREVPVMMLHGTADPIISLSFAERSCTELRAAGYAPEWRTYAMAHSVCPEEIRDISAWLHGLHAGFS